MKIDGVNKTNQIIKPKVEVPVENRIQNGQTDAGRISKLTSGNLAANLLKQKLNDAVSGNQRLQTTPVYFRDPSNGSTKGIFTDGGQGVEPGTEIDVSPLSPDATPEQGAHFIKMHSGPDGAKATLMADALEAHKDDPEWQKNFLSALGPDMTGKLIGDLANPATYPGGYPNVMRDNVDNLLNTLDTLQQNGALTQESVNTLVNSMQKNGFNPYIATDVFAKASPAVKEMFVNAAISNGNDTLDAAASHVLNTMNGADQSRILGGLSDERLNSFIEGAMAGQQEMISLSDKIKNPNASWDQSSHTTFGGVQGILSQASDRSLPYSPYFAESPFPPELQDKIFNAVTQGLNNQKAFDNFKDNTVFKDVLSRVLQTNFDRIVSGELAKDGVNGEDFSKDFQEGYAKALELTLFTPPAGSEAKSLANFIDGKYSAIANDINQLGDAEFKEKYGTERAAMARAHGQLTGLFFKALEDGLNATKDDAEAQGKMLETVFNFSGAVVGGLGNTTGQSVIASVASKLIETVGEGVAEKFADGKYKEAIEEMKSKGVNPEELIDKLYHQVYDNMLPNSTEPNGRQQLPDGTSVTIKDAWQNGYDHIEGAPRVP